MMAQGQSPQSSTSPDDYATSIVYGGEMSWMVGGVWHVKYFTKLTNGAH